MAALRRRLGDGRSTPMIAAALTVVAAVHAVAVGRHYHVGSFDDDANYILTARALADGAGLTSTLHAGYGLVAVYPIGYAALLAPLALTGGHATLPFRVLSLVALVALFPLVWSWLDRRRVPQAVRLCTLALLALNPVLATFSTMVMVELPFLVVLLFVVLAVDRWEGQAAVVTGAGVTTVLSVAALLWLKEAGVGVAAGVVLWLLLRRMRAKALVTAGAAGLLILPLIVARRLAGTPVLGSRYSDEFGGFYAGGVVQRLTHVVPHALSTYANVVLPQSVIPTSVGSPFPASGAVAAVLAAFGTTVTPLVVIGFIVCVRRHRDVSCVIVPVYLIETLAYPFVNERRIILVLPIILAWYVLGARAVGSAVSARVTRRHRWLAAPVWAPVVVVLVILLPQFGRDYLFALGEDSSHPGGSSYMGFLSRIGKPDDVVETDHLWTTALFSGHRTADSAFLAATPAPGVAARCDPLTLQRALVRDHAGYVLTGALGNGGLGSPCLVALIAASPSALALYRTDRNHADASVFELVGPGTTHPGVVDLTAGIAPVTGDASTAQPQRGPPAPAGDSIVAPAAGKATFTWTWLKSAPVSEVSLSAAGVSGDPTGAVGIELLGIDGRWHEVASAPGAVGDAGPTPYLLADLGSAGLVATAVRVTVAGSGRAEVDDLHVLDAG